MVIGKREKTLIIYDNFFCWASCTYFCILVTSVESNCHFRKNFICSTGFKSYTVKVFASKILFIVREINLETSSWGKIRLAVLLHEVLVVFIEKAENEIGIKRAVNRFLWDCCDRAKEIKAFMTETPKCDCQNPTPVQNTGAPNDTQWKYKYTRAPKENICSEHDLRSRSFGTFVVKFLACLPLLGFSNTQKMV